jgi:hypothetical protein
MSVIYSAQEKELIAHFGLSELIDQLGSAPALYRILAITAFVRNDQTPWADALRRCLLALESGTPQRGTSDWDALLAVETMR